MENRIQNHPILGDLQDKKEVSFTFNGMKHTGFEGDTIASALLANGIRQLRVQEETGTPRGIYCNIGHCFECRVTVNDDEGVRACLTEIQPNMVVEGGEVEPAPFKSDDGAENFPRTYAEFTKMKKSNGRGS